MTDKQKLALIDKIITDFYEHLANEQIAAGAEAIICAVCAVLDYSEED